MTTKAQIAKLSRVYQDIHWGAPAEKVIHVEDPYVPDCVAYGELTEIRIPDGVITLPEGTWLAFDPRRKNVERLYIIHTAAYREQVRKQMKYASPLVQIQRIAASAGGTQSKASLPSVVGTPMGALLSVTYRTFKVGEDEPGPQLYQHDFGHEHSRGLKPILAADCSGRFWICGGNYFCAVAGITG